MSRKVDLLISEVRKLDAVGTLKRFQQVIMEQYKVWNIYRHIEHIYLVLWEILLNLFC